MQLCNHFVLHLYINTTLAFTFKYCIFIPFRLNLQPDNQTTYMVKLTLSAAACIFSVTKLAEYKQITFCAYGLTY